MFALALAAFVAGVFVLQQQPELPGFGVLAAVALVALAAGGLALRARLRRDAQAGEVLVAAVFLFALAALGFVYAAWFAHGRLAVEVATADEGRDIDVVGVVAGLPAPTDRGVRFEFLVE